jgi:cellulose synthase/poly-beta-1,6-N-acetylglucosamine synthase-like glycosyltransferase
MRGNKLLIKSTLTPGISIVTGAFNEELNIISNVRSLLTMNYSLFEVIVVNDGSSDSTLEKLISEFSLVEVPFAYNYFLKCKTVLRVMKSENPAFANLIIVDKINGGSKADAINAGINVSTYPYFLNTDVDCILDKETLAKLIQPFIDDDTRVIASGAAMRMVNSCTIDSSVLIDAKVPRRLLPRFQEIEYIRSFALGKMGWNLVNCISNVSGGLGMFDKEIVIKAGGYDPRSFGEDMDMLIRMIKYMIDTKLKYAVRYIPQTLCWTEGPTSLTVFKRQRVRWARGLYQIFSSHFRLLFNPKYKKLGLIVLPYNFLFELFAPLIELLGIICYVYLIANHMLNWPYAIALLVFVYTFSILITLLAIVWDQLIMKRYGLREILKLCFWALLEPFIYHPLVMVLAVIGYVKQFFKLKSDWGCMERQGFIRTLQADTAISKVPGI